MMTFAVMKIGETNFVFLCKKEGEGGDTMSLGGFSEASELGVCGESGFTTSFFFSLLFIYN